MKTRSGFVSNSSSSSFCVVAISTDYTDPQDFELLKAVGFFPADAQPDDDDLELWPSYGAQGVNDDLVVIGSEEPGLLGIEAEGYLNGGYTVSQIGDMLLEILRKYGYRGNEKPSLEFGEAGNG